MDGSTLYKIIQRGIINQLNAEMEITPGLYLKEDLGAPSMKLVLFLTEVTQQIQLSIFDFSDYELLNLKTVADIFKLLSNKLKMKAEANLFDLGLVIENECIRLRLVCIQDIQELAELASDPVIWKYYPVNLARKEDMEVYVKNLLSEHANRKIIPFVIIDKKNGNRLTGMSCFGNISFPDRRIEIGWSWIGRPFQGTGINGTYKRLLLSYAFDVLDFVRVEFKTDVLNMQARKGLLKIGAIEEGILRSHTQMHSNRRRDTIYYSILKEDWDLLNKVAHESYYIAGDPL